MKKFATLLCSLSLLLFCNSAPAQEQEELTPEQAQMLKLLESLEPEQGEVTLPNGIAKLNVPEDFYYLGAADAKKVLVDIWGNPPESSAGVLGMLFPAGMTPFDTESWAVTVEYEEDGYVSDEDAGEIDYDDLLEQMKDGTRSTNKARVEQGYEPIELVGWAATPYYDEESHKLYWAKELKFGEQSPHTLNYNIRVLGRKGVLVLNFIAGMDQKPVIDSKIDTVLALAEFNDGYKYDQFNPEIDEVAAYGIGALVAGKVAAKTGLLAAALIFFKKFWVFVLAGLVAVFGKLFKRKQAA